MELSFPIPSSQDFNYGQNLFDSQELRIIEATRYGDNSTSTAVTRGVTSSAPNLLLTDSINTDVEDNLLSQLGVGSQDVINFLPDSYNFNLSQSSLDLTGGGGALDANVEQPIVGEEANEETPEVQPAANGGQLGNENICFDKYAGPFNFEVEPVKIGKGVWNKENNKYFCDVGTIEMEIRLDFAAIGRPEDFKIRLALIFTEPEHQETAVTKCMNCIGTQEKLPEDVDPELVYNILRGHYDDKSVTYCQNTVTQVRYLMIQLRYPELGSSALKQRFMVTCRSSCKSTESFGINRRPTAMVFTLLNRKNEVNGRSVMNLRICSAPSRDNANEFGPKRTNKRSATKVDPTDAPPNSRRAVEGEMHNGSVASRLRNALEPIEVRTDLATCSRYLTRARGPPNASLIKLNNGVAKPGPRVIQVKPLDLDNDGLPLPLFQNSQDTSSQETVYEFMDADDIPRHSLRLKKLTRDARKVLNWLSSDNKIQRDAAMRLFDCLRYANEICETSKHAIQTEQNNTKMKYGHGNN